MGAPSVFALMVVAHALCMAEAGVGSGHSSAATTVHDPAGHVLGAQTSTGPADAEGSALSWSRIVSIVAFAATEFRRILPTGSPLALQPVPASSTLVVPSTLIAPTVPANDGWEAKFAWGLYHSKVVTEVADRNVGHWVVDRRGSRAGVPARMVQAEELLLAADDAPAERYREKTAERALRLYYHAKWLAERNFATAAEWRYREAHRLARLSRRSVLAAHAFSRLGYFLIHWRRHSEAREVLRESERLSRKSNPLAPYLYGVLERQAAGPDTKRLLAAEERILSSEEQPSEELEAERRGLLKEIDYWRAAEQSPRRCFETFDTAHVIVCLCGHLFLTLRQAVVA
mmetsp:Transcript_86536/g.280171  ORF Transcript_86536/g.280171 Transcript_86536/m.280171 type:complete len:344 (-) Transcript_86536:237-1268(-)